jgi:hypothetical protein
MLLSLDVPGTNYAYSNGAIQDQERPAMTTENETTQIDVRDNAYETIPVFWRDWPDEALLADFVEQNARAEKNDQAEQADRPIEDSSEYAFLYFVS